MVIYQLRVFSFLSFSFFLRERVIKGLIDGYGNDPDRIAFLLISRVIPATHTQLKVIYTLSFSNSDPQKPIASFRQLQLQASDPEVRAFEFEVELKLEKKTSEREIILGPENEPANEPKIVAPR